MMRNILKLPHRCKIACKEREIKGFFRSVQLSNNYYNKLCFKLQNIFNEINLCSLFSELPAKGNYYITLRENLRWERN